MGRSDSIPKRSRGHKTSMKKEKLVLKGRTHSFG
jgi:hypothetical protein